MRPSGKTLSLIVVAALLNPASPGQAQNARDSYDGPTLYLAPGHEAAVTASVSSGSFPYAACANVGPDLIGNGGTQAQPAGGKPAKRKSAHPEVVVRDVERLQAIKTIAVVPVVIQLSLDREKRLPDPTRMRARLAAAVQTSSQIIEAGSAAPYRFFAADEVRRTLNILNWTPTDLYIVKHGAAWAAPAEVVKDNRQDEFDLAVKRDEMKQSPAQISLFRYSLPDAAEPMIGLAAYKEKLFAQPDPDKARVLRKKLGVDAVLLLQVSQIEDSRGLTTNGALVGGLIFGQRAEKTKVHLQATLIGGAENSILWQAGAIGSESKRTGLFHAGEMKSELETLAAACTEDAVQMLLSDLIDGDGTPARKTKAR